MSKKLFIIFSTIPVLVFFMGFHALDLAVNILILDPDQFYNGSDCALLVCRDYPTIYKTGNVFMMWGFIMLWVMVLVEWVQEFKENPHDTNTQRDKNKCAEKPKTRVNAHELEEKQ